MLILLAVLSFVIALVTHDGGAKFLTLDYVGWTIVGLAFFAASHIWNGAPWNQWGRGSRVP